ncbi:transposase [Stieleria sp. ICT_E10.1]|uniref:transposase n=1 Tax=Stieleria sedimenti TaxID=2976331 RepID=UPI00217FC400|nr:transposase [Stieleria sedimenti]MCS7466043.1 transposase [Stieleria sedimenti]
MNPTSPLALFITWTVYGTFLPGDARGWRHCARGEQTPRPKLEKWNRDRLKHDIVLLDTSMQETVESAINEICEFRVWTLWAVGARRNHIHVVATAPDYKPTIVRDQMKAKATRELRESFGVWKDRSVWSAKGDIEFLDTEEEIEQCVIYVTEAQDRKNRDLS